MNRKLIGIPVTAALLLLIGVPSISAQTVLKATVSFAFTVGKTELPAGTYTISSISSSAIAIGDNNTAKGVLSLVRGEDSSSGSNGSPKLVFHKYANRYFLSQVSRGLGHIVMQLPTSKLEKELQIASASSASAQETVVATK